MIHCLCAILIALVLLLSFSCRGISYNILSDAEINDRWQDEVAPKGIDTGRVCESNGRGWLIQAKNYFIN